MMPVFQSKSYFEIIRIRRAFSRPGNEGYMKKEIKWCAIGDSFTYLNDHLDETAYRVKEGYLTRTCGYFDNLSVINIGMNGSSTPDWIRIELPEADLYTVLLGTNDWHGGVPLGKREDFRLKKEGTILGNLGLLISHIREKSPEAELLVMNSVERGDFVYILDPLNNAHGSYLPDQGQWLADIAEAIYEICCEEGIPALNLHDLSGFTPENVVRFKRVKTPGGYRNLPYPEYTKYPVCFDEDEYPYPPEAADFTYDGLHPSDKGNEVIASLLAARLKMLMGDRLQAVETNY